MTASIRQQLVDAIEARLGSIAPGVAFQLPGGSYVCQGTIKGVYPWRKAAFSQTEVPAIKLDDADAKTSPGPSTMHEHKLQVDLELYVAGKTSTSAVRSLMADVIAAVGSDPRWGGLAYWTDIDGHTVDVEQAGDVISAALVNLTVTYRTPLWRM